MKKILKILFFIASLFLLFYVLPQSPEFPKPLPASVQSFEPADVETPLRRGYYTNLTRQEIIEHYQKEFNEGFIYTPRLNYPPEEAPALIRDQTKSTFLEELVHPLRESLFINGFESKKTIYQLVIDGVTWDQKVIVRYVPSAIWLRVLIVFLTIVSTIVLMREYQIWQKKD
ncbi:MAG: hypothetical protein UR39_C0001G0153 [Candidatus Woesebacteria bacterium GW2011_GWA1_33_30]|uniref:Uncharacterized protein n=1 Tax=Candidatus Woesebacteria bacterium GW2011_GWA2_33_28 TaxID=1618561 RepID=A0A0F9ZV99_9BACT|nr:MAG: hypothetical protein UR38_C0001G0154 [Candidatus Woesebacteria bacterium GW2011_GWA2_33_28]KKP49120.1 MAG: hypothetical protein UR39_C0001G0153 [Candidatus Woesebacteria bacterium GW2011_GWA1_33_30]KKP50280.1 MAG: hypothetical protein UR40_C0001G0022 [Microgenomates group bacterium GW2011_GWC1_33_32]KKP52711.1 MAG: hypothetical protein UR44_C0001G0153 [Candidatus Woesebacteria bacterium GW2011_GWB1_33_38]KKP58706.1 MAG: hypothetical protein UR48_C0002G0002 [Microgenomates group bacteriu